MHAKRLLQSYWIKQSDRFNNNIKFTTTTTATATATATTTTHHYDEKTLIKCQIIFQMMRHLPLKCTDSTVQWPKTAQR